MKRETLDKRAAVGWNDLNGTERDLLITLEFLQKYDFADGDAEILTELLGWARTSAPSTSTVRERLRALDEFGLVSQLPHPDDGRRSIWILQPAGFRVLEQHRRVMQLAAENGHSVGEALFALNAKLGDSDRTLTPPQVDEMVGRDRSRPTGHRDGSRGLL